MVRCTAGNHPDLAYPGNVRKLKLLESHLSLFFFNPSNERVRNCPGLFEYLFQHKVFEAAFFSHRPCPAYCPNRPYNLFSFKVHERELFILEDSHVTILQKNKTVCPVENCRCIAGNKVFSISNTHDQRAFFFRCYHYAFFFVDNTYSK